MSKEANNYTTKSNSTPLPTGKGVRLIISLSLIHISEPTRH